MTAANVLAHAQACGINPTETAEYGKEIPILQLVLSRFEVISVDVLYKFVSLVRRRVEVSSMSCQRVRLEVFL